MHPSDQDDYKNSKQSQKSKKKLLAQGTFMTSRKDFEPDVREIIRKMKIGMTKKEAIEALEALACEMDSNSVAWSREVADYNANSNPG